MNGEFMLIVLVGAAALLVLLIARLASFLRAFIKDAQYICYRMDCANSFEEYRCWRGELRCHYLCLIPFVNGKNVMRVYSFFFHRGDNSGKQKRKDSIVPLLMPSVLGICLCVVCVCGMTWAWYSASVQTSPQKMTAAYYEVTVSVKENTTEVDPVSVGCYNLTAGTAYTVDLTAVGTVEKCGGYCLIGLNGSDTEYYTQTLLPGQSITVEFKPDQNGTYTFTGVWGSIKPDVMPEQILHAITSDGDNTGGVPADKENVASSAVNISPDSAAAESTAEAGNSYTVQPGDTLSDIAKKYDVTAARLAAYNNISDPGRISVGQVLDIPPQDYVIPESAVTGKPVTVKPETSEPEVSEPSGKPETNKSETGKPTPSETELFFDGLVTEAVTTSLTDASFDEPITESAKSSFDSVDTGQVSAETDGGREAKE